MIPEQESDRATRWLVVVAALVIIAAGLELASKILVPILLGIFIAVAAEPIGRKLLALGSPRYLATSATIVAVLTATVGVGTLIGVAANQLSNSLPKLQSAVLRARDRIIYGLDQSGLDPVARALKRLDLAEGLPEATTMGVRAIAGFTGALLMVLLVAIFILLEWTTLRPKVHRLVKGSAEAEEQVVETLEDVQRYILLKTGISAATGLFVGILCGAFDLDGATLWGVVAFAFNYVPVVGSLLAAIPAVLFAWASLGFVPAIAIAGGYTGINLVIGQILEPRIFGRSFDLSPLVVILSMLLWGFLLGPVGALLAVPLTMIVKITCERSQRSEWIAVLLSSGRGLERL